MPAIDRDLQSLTYMCAHGISIHLPCAACGDLTVGERVEAGLAPHADPLPANVAHSDTVPLPDGPAVAMDKEVLRGLREQYRVERNEKLEELKSKAAELKVDWKALVSKRNELDVEIKEAKTAFSTYRKAIDNFRIYEGFEEWLTGQNANGS